MLRTQVLPDSIASRRDSAHSPLFRCSRADSSPDTAWVHLAGALDYSTVSQLARTLRKLWARERLIVLDLRDLESIYFFGVHAIANASTKARQTGRQLVLLRGTPDIERMFTLAGRSHEVEIGDFESGEPAAQAPPRLDAR